MKVEKEESEIEAFVAAAIERGMTAIISIKPVVTEEGLEYQVVALEDCCGRIVPTDMGVKE